MNSVVLLSFILAVAKTNGFSQEKLMMEEVRGVLSQENNREFISVCPTILQAKYVTTAIHYFTKTKVYLTSEHGMRGRKFSMGKCSYETPISNAGGICAITMQRHRTWIRCTAQQAEANKYRRCFTVRSSPNLRDCMEWVELPGLCQLKIPL